MKGPFSRSIPAGTEYADDGVADTPGSVSLVIVEDHPALADGLVVLARATNDIRIVGLARDASRGSELIAATHPDVVLCDVMLGDRDAGFDLLRQHAPRTRFLMYSAFDFPSHHARAIASGASGFVSKVADTETLLRAIRRVAAGGRWFSAEVLASARGAARTPTARERELLGHLVDGASNGQIAAALGIGIKTVEGTIRRLFDRYGLDNRTQLAHLATREGWLTSGRAAAEGKPEP
jgi:DNA-binding NarL/FixJ family response regulator